MIKLRPKVKPKRKVTETPKVQDDPRIFPIEQELHRISQVIDENNWQGEETDHLERMRDRLIQRITDGEVWETTF